MSEPSGLLSTYGVGDEALHEPKVGEEHYSESAYLDFVTGADEGVLGGTMRVGLRPTDGYGELSIVLALGDGSFVFRYERQELEAAGIAAGSPTMRCGAMEIAAVEPLRVWSVSFASAETRRVTDLAGFARRPGETWRASPTVATEVDLRWEGSHPPHMVLPGGNLLPGEYGAAHGRDHYEQFGHYDGTITIDGERHRIEAAPSFRDHTWGPRDWDFGEAEGLIAFFEDGGRMVGNSMHAHGSSPAVGFGMLWLPGADDVEVITGFDPVTQYRGEPELPAGFRALITAGGRKLDLEIRVIAMMPLRVGARSRLAQALVAIEGPLGPGRAWMDLSRLRTDE